MPHVISNDPIVQRAREEDVLLEERMEQKRLAFREELEGILMFENDRDDGLIDCHARSHHGGG